MQLSLEGALRAVDIGPLADSPQAAEFQQFWGEKAEMRRFQVSYHAPQASILACLPDEHSQFEGQFCASWNADSVHERSIFPSQQQDKAVSFAHICCPLPAMAIRLCCKSLAEKGF